jgi:predicted transcriptional regulator
MNPRDLPLPTEAEFRVLGALWTHGDQTVRQVHEQLRDGWAVGYTTVLKILQNLHEKGLVSRDDSERSHVYRAAVERDWATRGYVTDLTERVFGGSAAELVMRALSSQRATPEELEQIRSLLDDLEEGP